MIHVEYVPLKHIRHVCDIDLYDMYMVCMYVLHCMSSRQSFNRLYQGICALIHLSTGPQRTSALILILWLQWLVRRWRWISVKQLYAPYKLSLSSGRRASAGSRMSTRTATVSRTFCSIIPACSYLKKVRLQHMYMSCMEKRNEYSLLWIFWKILIS